MSKYGRQSNVVLVFGPDDKVLALRRSSTDKWKPGHWNFPGGRRDDRDRTAQEGAARELREEAGISVDPQSLKWAFSYRYPGLINVFWVKLPYRPKVSHPDREHDAHVWARLWEIPQPSIPHVRYIVEQITGQTWNLAPVGSTPSDLGSLYGAAGTGETPLGGRNMSSKWNESDYLAYWPKYLPFPYAIKRGRRPVPNVNSVDWPQAQFAPPYLPPGSPSFQPYSYTKNDVPLRSQQPHYTTVNYGPYRQSGVGPGGDLARLPIGYGATMYFNPAVSFTDEERDYTVTPPPVNTELPSGNHASVGLGRAKLLKIARAVRKLKRKQKLRRSRKRALLIKKYILMYKALKAELQAALPGEDFDVVKRKKARKKARKAAQSGGVRRYARRRRAKKRVKNYIEKQALAVEAAGTLPAPSLALPVTPTKWGMSVTSAPIASGVPTTAAPIPLDPIATAATPVELGDGFAYELAPVTASNPYLGYGSLMLENPRHRAKKKKKAKAKAKAALRRRAAARRADCSRAVFRARMNPDYVEFKALLVEWYDSTLSREERIHLARSLVKLMDRYGIANLVERTALTPAMAQSLYDFADAHGYGYSALENPGCGCQAQSNPGWFTDDEGGIQWGPVLAVAGVAGVAYWVGTEGMTKPLFA